MAGPGAAKTTVKSVTEVKTAEVAMPSCLSVGRITENTGAGALSERLIAEPQMERGRSD